MTVSILRRTIRQGNAFVSWVFVLIRALLKTPLATFSRSADGHFKYVVTPNVHHMVRMLEDPAVLRPLYEGAWRVFCDSRVLSRLARVGGLTLPVITGSDLTADLIAHAAKRGTNDRRRRSDGCGLRSTAREISWPSDLSSHPKNGIYKVGTGSPQMRRFCCQSAGSPGFSCCGKTATRNSRESNRGSSRGTRSWLMHRRLDRFSNGHPTPSAALCSESRFGMDVSPGVRSAEVCSTVPARISSHFLFCLSGVEKKSELVCYFEFACVETQILDCGEAANSWTFRRNGGGSCARRQREA